MIRINGVETELISRLEDLIEKYQRQDKQIAVIVNDVVIPRKSWPGCTIKDGDEVEIVGFVGGG